MGIDVPQCRARLKLFSERYEEFLRCEAEIIAISADDLKTNGKLASDLDLPYPLLSDPDGEAIEKYTYWRADGRAPLPSLFITDRFGTLYTQHVGSKITELPDLEEVLDWLKSIQMQCPECPQI